MAEQGESLIVAAKPLTPEQEAYLLAFRQEQLEKALNPKRIDRDHLSGILARAYALIGQPAPHLIICESPAQAVRTLALIENGTVDPLSIQAGIASPISVTGKISRYPFLWGNHDMYWIAWARFALYLGMTLEPATLTRLDIAEDIACESGWWWPYKGFVVASEKPVYTKWDDHRRLHSVTGPSVEYSDGYRLYSWHGIRVPGDWIEKKAITPQDALRWPNIEQRRAACEILGWGKILEVLNARVIDRDPNPEIGELLEVDIPDIGRERFLKVLCGTKREFVLSTSIEMQTARQANARSYRKLPHEYNPEIRT